MMRANNTFNEAQHDPVKVYIEKSLKNLVLGNFLTGPSLCGDHTLSRLLNQFYTTKIDMRKDPSIYYNQKLTVSARGKAGEQQELILV